MESQKLSERLQYLRELLSSGDNSTQERLARELNKKGFQVTQSTISRDLRKIGAVKSIDSDGQTSYRLAADATSLPMAQSSLSLLVTSIQDNGYLIVIQTTPGSASLVARQIDSFRREGILGTIAGDDTVFVAPNQIKRIGYLVRLFKNEFGLSLE